MRTSGQTALMINLNNSNIGFLLKNAPFVTYK